MMIISSREFRANQKKYLGLARTNDVDGEISYRLVWLGVRVGTDPHIG